MKLIKTLFDYLALLLIVGGLAVMGLTYTTKKEILNALVSNTIVKSSMSVLKTLGLSLAAIIIGLICLVIAMRIGGAVRKVEKEKRAALKEQQKENEALNKQLKKEAEEAKAEAEKARKEMEKMEKNLHSEEVSEEKE